MLVLNRKANESIIIGDNITVTVVRIDGDQVRIGIEAPRAMEVHRQEVKERIDRERATSDQFPVPYKGDS